MFEILKTREYATEENMRSFSGFNTEKTYKTYMFTVFIVFLIERYFMHEKPYNQAYVYSNFYTYNYLRVIAILLPFFFFSMQSKSSRIKSTLHNAPFLFLGLSSVAMVHGQFTYLLLFTICCFIIKELRLFGIVGLSLLIGLIIVLPHFVGGDSPDKGSIKANMHTFQTALETYALDNKGHYPENALLLRHVAEREMYWKDFKNPVTQRIGYSLSFGDISENKRLEMEKRGPDRKSFHDVKSDIDFLGIRLFSALDTGGVTGQVLYQRKSLKSYAIYGSFIDGEKLIFDRDKLFSLSNTQ